MRTHTLTTLLLFALILTGCSTDPADPPALSQSEARTTLGLPAGSLILTVARLTAWKGVGPLIRAVAESRDVRLLVAGTGPLQAELQRLASECGTADRVTFLGHQPRPQIASLMRAADYVALYSGYEGLSHTLLESLRAGTPIIASDNATKAKPPSAMFIYLRTL